MASVQQECQLQIAANAKDAQRNQAHWGGQLQQEMAKSIAQINQKVDITAGCVQELQAITRRLSDSAMNRDGDIKERIDALWGGMQQLNGQSAQLRAAQESLTRAMERWDSQVSSHLRGEFEGVKQKLASMEGEIKMNKDSTPPVSPQPQTEWVSSGRWIEHLNNHQQAAGRRAGAAVAEAGAARAGVQEEAAAEEPPTPTWTRRTPTSGVAPHHRLSNPGVPISLLDPSTAFLPLHMNGSSLNAQNAWVCGKGEGGFVSERAREC